MFLTFAEKNYFRAKQTAGRLPSRIPRHRSCLGKECFFRDGDPSQPFRDLHGYAISAKRYCLFEGRHARKIIDAKAHGIGYLMNPIQRKPDEHEDHEVDVKCKVYEARRVVADAETIRQLTRFSERQIRGGTGLRRDTIRSIRNGNGVKRATYERIIDFLRSSAVRS